MSAPAFPTPLVSTAWLAEHLQAPWLRVIDASMFLPSAGRDARSEYTDTHIPGAVFCDINWISTAGAPFPHTLPTAEHFAACVSVLGVANDNAVVVYDSSGQHYSAPRLWWMFRVFGHARVAVLDGGLPKWLAESRPTESAVPQPMPATFAAQLDAGQVRSIDDMRENLVTQREQVLDARSPGRFAGTEPEPRAGVRGGHIPQSVNVHYAALVHDDGTLRAPDALRTFMRERGVDASRPLVASCGTGVTACAVVLALTVLGVNDVAVYDGSWTEWGSSLDAPVQLGAMP